MMLGWASACPIFFDFWAKNLQKSVDKIYAIAYNIKCQGEMEKPQNNEEENKNEVQHEEHHEKRLEHPQVR